MTLDEATLAFKQAEVELHRYLNLMLLYPKETRTRALYQEALMAYTDAARVWGAVEAAQLQVETELEEYQPAPDYQEMH